MRQSNQNKRLLDIASKIPEPKAAWQRRPRVAGKLRIIAVAERIEWTQRVIDEPAIPEPQRERLINITASLPKILKELFQTELAAVERG